MKVDRQEYQKAYRRKYKDQAKRVNLTFSREEAAALEKAAKASGMTLSGFVKSLALDGFNKEVTLPEELGERLEGFDRYIRNIANNVNQMAKHSNRLGKVLDEQEVLLHLSMLDAELRNVIASFVFAKNSGGDE